MFEIEMKAHVSDRDAVISKLDSFSEYQCSIVKTDSYYRVPLSKNPESYKSMRIRHEKVSKPATSTGECTSIEKYIFTYKPEREIRQNSDGTTTEVNSELECEISDPNPFIKFCMDLGATPGIIKNKIVECWHIETDCGTANIELCTVPPLGDFLEIEIVAETSDTDFVEKAKKIEEDLFLRCGISLEQVEPRYYSEMLSAANANKQQK